MKKKPVKKKKKIEIEKQIRENFLVSAAWT